MGEQQKVNQADTDLNHVLKARRDKLVELALEYVKEHSDSWKGPFPDYKI